MSNLSGQDEIAFQLESFFGDEFQKSFQFPGTLRQDGPFHPVLLRLQRLLDRK